MYARWDGGGTLEVYRTPDDSKCSMISLNILKDDYTVWYDNKKNKPDVKDYRLKVIRDIRDDETNEILFFTGECFFGFKRAYSE
jgi:hypothetical protein